VNKLVITYIEKFKYFILFLLVILFPVNQQLHIRPFSSIDGVIIDYLMVKISIPEILLMILSILNIRYFYSLFIDKFKKITFVNVSLLICFCFIILNIWNSNYLNLSIYENLIMVLIFLNSLTLIYYEKLDVTNLISLSLKFWMVILLLLGLFQVYFQESVLGSYYYFGEFTYSSDNYHIKQDGFIFKNLIPAYGIFSHSNIYGGFFLICSMFLHLLKRNNVYFTFIAIVGVIISGSLNILIGLILFFIFYYLNLNIKFLILYPIFIFFLISFLSLDFKKYSEDLSVYRRVYMINLSNQKFLENLTNTFIGFGYYNYFKFVSEDLYFYEIIRFFQPPHNVFYFLIWNYGLIFLISFTYLLFKMIKNSSHDFQLIALMLISISMFDHFLFTNHQMKMLLFLLLPYSLNRVFSIRMK